MVAARFVSELQVSTAFYATILPGLQTLYMHSRVSQAFFAKVKISFAKF